MRVLVDSDRAEDPYLSTVINHAAIIELSAHGIPVRTDAPNELLHSKVVIVDEVVLIGSHNWTAGSYFAFDDLTLAIRSSALAEDQLARFDALWNVAVDV